MGAGEDEPPALDELALGPGVEERLPDPNPGKVELLDGTPIL